MADVFVKMTGRQKKIDGTVDEVVSEAFAELTPRGGKHYVRYLDETLVEGEKVQVTLKIADDALTVLRRGAVEATFHYAEGKSSACLYRTPLGVFSMRHETKTLQMDFDGAEGVIELVYDAYIADALQGEQVLRIEVKRRN